MGKEKVGMRDEERKEVLHRLRFTDYALQITYLVFRNADHNGCALLSLALDQDDRSNRNLPVITA